jgi:hypothetical protein
MWTSKNRGRYDRSALRYPSDLTDDEWALIEPLIPPARAFPVGIESEGFPTAVA